MKIWGKIAAGTLSLAVSVAALGLWAVRGFGVEKTGSPARLDGIADRFQMHADHALADAASGVMAIPKRYWIARDALRAPEPDPACYGEASEPEELQKLLDRAESVLEGQELYFTAQTELLPGTSVHYYLDETILAITWKQAMDESVYTFSEVKIMHPSQFRRFLAGGAYGTGEQHTTTQMARSVNAVVASSGDFYAYRLAGIIVYDGLVRRTHNGIADTCYVDENGDLCITSAQERMDREAAQAYVDRNRIQFSLAFGPTLVRQGQACTPGEYGLGQINDCYPRAALCQMDRLHYLLATVNTEDGYPRTPTIHGFAQRIQQTGCRTAYALDGGQTAALAMDGELVNAVMYGSQRAISDIVYFATALPR